MSSRADDPRSNPLIRALEAELAEDPAEVEKLPLGMQRRRDSWLVDFRAGRLPFQQDDDAPVLDDLELEHWLLLSAEAAFRGSSGGTGEPTLRAADDDAVTVAVQRRPDGTGWQVRLRNAAPGRYRVELHWEGTRDTASVEVTVVGNRSEFTPIPGPPEPPTHARFAPIAD